MALMLYPLRYLALQDEKSKTLARRDALPTVSLAAFLALPFVLLPDTNFFGSGGFLATTSGLSSALAGFYVAALVAAATIARGSDLDSPIQVGKIIRIETVEGKREPQPLSRREYVCALFGYLSFLAFAMSVVINLVVAIAGSKYLGQLMATAASMEGSASYVVWLSPISKFLICLPISHLFVVTTYGLYYLIKRLYEQKPKLVAPLRKAETPKVSRLQEGSKAIGGG